MREREREREMGTCIAFALPKRRIFQRRPKDLAKFAKSNLAVQIADASAESPPI